MKNRSVITGLGAVSPPGVGQSLFWQALESGQSFVDRITLFDTDHLPVKIAAEVRGVNFESILPASKLRAVHRVVPITLLAAKEAIEDSGLLSKKSALKKADVIVGTAAHGLGYFEEQQQQFIQKGYKGVSPHSCTGTFVGMLSSEISMYFGCHGMSLVVSTGCTSAHDSIGYALSLINSGRSKIVITGGGESCITPLVVGSFSKMGALAKSWNNDPKRASRPFDNLRDGFVIGEGAWIVVLEELEHAKKRGANIYAEVCGYGATSDAYHKTAPDPTGKYLTKAMKLALSDAKVDREEINYINPHGTSTPLNDKTETLAIKKCFGSRSTSIPISSFKASLGHAQGASGACGLAGTILAIRNKVIPPTINQEIADPECDLDYVPNIAREQTVTAAILNSVAFGSRNASLIVKKYKD